MIDPSKLPVVEDEFPDFWLIKVERVVANGSTGRKQTAAHELIKCRTQNEQGYFTSIYDYFDWLGPVIQEFESIQMKAMNDDQSMKEISFCHEHNRPTKVCGCSQIQSGVRILLPEDKHWGEDFYDVDTTEVRDYQYDNRTDKYFVKITPNIPGVKPRVHACNVVCPSKDERKQIASYDKTAKLLKISEMEVQTHYSDIIDETVRRRLESEHSWLSATRS